MTVGRTPLMAGNWKMNLDHLQATHLVQKLDWTLKDGRHDFGAVEVAVLPPFTDIRSVQTLIDGDRLELKHGAQDLSVHDAGAYTGESSHGATKSLYGADPDGNEFELMWLLPREEWGPYEHSAPIDRLDLAAEVARWSGVRTATPVMERAGDVGA